MSDRLGLVERLLGCCGRVRAECPCVICEAAAEILRLRVERGRVVELLREAHRQATNECEARTATAWNGCQVDGNHSYDGAAADVFLRGEKGAESE